MPYSSILSGQPVAIKDEGLTLTDAARSIDFQGSGVTGSAIGSDVTESIPGGAGASTSPNETLTNTGDDTNFTFAHAPIDVLAVWVSETGQVISDYSVVASTLTLATPMPASTLKATYTY